MSINCIGNLPESLTQELLIGKLLVGGLGVLQVLKPRQAATITITINIIITITITITITISITVLHYISIQQMLELRGFAA